MARRIPFVLLIALILVLTGCLALGQENQKLAYVCPDGQTVQDPTQCTQTSSTSTTSTTSSTSTTTPPTTTSTESTSTTTITTTTTSSTSTTSTTLEPRPVLELVDIDDSLQGPGGEFYLGGKIRNNGDKEAFYVQVQLTLFDRFGKSLKVINSAPIDVIDPGATSEFNKITTEILKSHVNSYNLTVFTGQ